MDPDPYSQVTLSLGLTRDPYSEYESGSTLVNRYLSYRIKKMQKVQDLRNKFTF